MRHATQDDLDRAEPLLMELRLISQLRERQRGSFSRGARAFLHFHEHDGDLFVDVRLGARFERRKVTGEAEQADFLKRVRATLLSDHSST